MITEYIDAWRDRKEDFREWLENDVNANTIEYFEILKGVIETVINPSINENCETLNVNKIHISETLNANKIHIIDDGDYQGTTIYLIPKDVYQPDSTEYVWTDNYYGSCSGCDTLMALQGWGEEVEEKTIDGIMTIALHFIEKMRPLIE